MRCDSGTKRTGEMRRRCCGNDIEDGEKNIPQTRVSCPISARGGEEEEQRSAVREIRRRGSDRVRYVLLDLISLRFHHQTRRALLVDGAVKENYRRQGHGESLLKAAISKCRTRNIHRISLHVDPSRTAAMALYRKLGFQIDELIHCYYSRDRDAYRMFLESSDHN